MQRFLREERGSVLPIFALTIGSIAVLLSAVLTFGLQYLEDRRMQALADLIALVAVRDQDYSTRLAHQVIADQGLDTALFAPILTPGIYTPDPDLPPLQRFQPGMRPYNAVRVDLHARHQGESGRSYIAGLLAEAAAARRDSASFAVGSRLIRLEDGLSGELLSALLGYEGRITALDYEALADVRVDSLGLLNAIAGGARLRAVTYDDILDARVPPQSILRALDRVAGSDSPGILDRLAQSALQRAGTVRVGDVLQAQALAGAPLLSETAGARVSALDVVEATALAAQGDHQLALGADAQLARVQLAIGERPQSPSIDAFSLPGSRAETRQLDLLTRIRLGLSDLDVRLEAARAEAVLTGVSCRRGGQVRADFDVTTLPARLVVSTGRRGAALLDVNLGSGEVRRVRMTERHIRSGSPETLRSGLGAQASLADQLLLPGIVGTALVPEVDRLLEELGLHISEADLFLRDAQCGHAFLIE